MRCTVSVAVLGWCAWVVHGQQEVNFVHFVDLEDYESPTVRLNGDSPVLGKVGDAAAVVLPLPDGVHVLHSDGNAAPSLTVLPYPANVEPRDLRAGFLFDKVALVCGVDKDKYHTTQRLLLQLFNADGTLHNEIYVDAVSDYIAPRTVMCDLPGGRALLVMDSGHEVVINATHVLSIRKFGHAPIFYGSPQLQFLGIDAASGNETVMFRSFGSPYIFHVGAAGSGVSMEDDSLSIFCPAFGGLLMGDSAHGTASLMDANLTLRDASGKKVLSNYISTGLDFHSRMTCSSSGDRAVVTWLSWPDFPLGHLDSLRRQYYTMESGHLLPSSPIFEVKVAGVPQATGSWLTQSRNSWIATADVWLDQPQRFGQLLQRGRGAFALGVQVVPSVLHAVAPPLTPAPRPHPRHADGVRIFTSSEDYFSDVGVVSLGDGWVAAVLPDEKPFTAKFWRNGHVQRVAQLHGTGWACVGRIGAKLAVFHDCHSTSLAESAALSLVDPVSDHVDTVNLTAYRVLRTCQRDDGRLVAAVLPDKEDLRHSDTAHVQFVDFTDAGVIDWRSPVYEVSKRFGPSNGGQLHCLSDRSLALTSPPSFLDLTEQTLLWSGGSNAAVVNTTFADRDSISCDAAGMLVEVGFRGTAPSLFDVTVQLCSVTAAQLQCATPVPIGSVTEPAIHGSCTALPDGRVVLAWLPIEDGFAPPDELWRAVIRFSADKQISIVTPPAAVVGLQQPPRLFRSLVFEAPVDASTLFSLVSTDGQSAVWLNTTMPEEAAATASPTPSPEQGSTPPSPSPHAGESEPSRTSTAVLLVAVVLVALGGVAAFVVVGMRRRRQTQQPHNTEADPEGVPVDADDTLPEQCSEMQMPMHDDPLPPPQGEQA
eukprot:TRINITY_DN16239_c0_g1_i1.p1 TRINITY_DN16239_c0_g1~~TRINITY_DN16239_c0_g1_i1.p1  ORF type:complete len:907 (+),score=254.19 TRINITY_DN16239_c0_g1_i1:104-2722(+)